PEVARPRGGASCLPYRGGAPPPPPPLARPIVASAAAASGQRPAGSGARQRRTNSASHAGSERTSSRGSDSGAGGRPVSISWVTTPTANMPSRGPAGVGVQPERRSGAIYGPAHSVTVATLGFPPSS